MWERRHRNRDRDREGNVDRRMFNSERVGTLGMISF